MSDVDQVLNQARAWLGCNESDGSYQQIIDAYNQHVTLARGYRVKYSDNWCMVYVSAVFIKVNFAALCPLECSCGEAIELAKNMGIWEENDDIVPTSGMLIMYDWDKHNGWPDHVGIVESVADQQITVLEGNKKNAVGRRTIAVGDPSIRGYVIPHYDGSVHSASEEVPTAVKNVNYHVKVNTPSGVNCRTLPHIDGQKITTYANGTELYVTKENNGWLYVNDTGWVCGQYCAKIQTGTVSKPTGTYEVRVKTALIVRVDHDGSSRRKVKAELTADGQAHANANGGLLNGTRVTVSKWYGQWAKIPSGWVCGDYLVKV